MKANNPVVWFEIYVQDMPRAKAFYEKVLGLTLSKLDTPDPSMEMWQFPSQEDGGGATGALCKMGGVPSGGSGTMVYFSCEDCATEAGRVKGAGGQVLKDKFSIGQYGAIAIATDPDGNCFGMHSMS